MFSRISHLAITFKGEASLSRWERRREEERSGETYGVQREGRKKSIENCVDDILKNDEIMDRMKCQENVSKREIEVDIVEEKEDKNGAEEKEWQ